MCRTISARSADNGTPTISCIDGRLSSSRLCRSQSATTTSIWQNAHLSTDTVIFSTAWQNACPACCVRQKSIDDIRETVYWQSAYGRLCFNPFSPTLFLIVGTMSLYQSVQRHSGLTHRFSVAMDTLKCKVRPFDSTGLVRVKLLPTWRNVLKFSYDITLHSL